jgi:hypothetical protein
VESLSRAQVVLCTVVGVCVLAIGFVAGSAIGDGGDVPSSSGTKPTRIVTRQGSVDLPTMREVVRVPPLDVREQTVEATVGESTAPVYTPSTTPEEAAAEEPESSAPTRESAPEVTVAPNG